MLSELINPRQPSQESQQSASQDRRKRPKTGISRKSATQTPATVATHKAPVIPLVRCRDCQHFRPDSINPAQGMGQCRIDADGDPAQPGYRLPYPGVLRMCSGFEITRAALFARCEEVAEGTDIDPSKLCQFLIDQGDPEWMQPAAIERWAGMISSGGWPKD